MNIRGIEKSSAANIFTLILHSEGTSSFGLGVKIGASTLNRQCNPMGFDLFINLHYQLCPETGKPCYYSKKTFEKVYTLPTMTVPHHLIKYLQGRGKIFHAYIEEFDQSDLTTTSVDAFVAEYPLWDQVKSSDWYDESWEDIWTEKEHNEFRELLVHLKESYDCHFTVEWSY